jgi:hypothetical protein
MGKKARFKCLMRGLVMKIKALGVSATLKAIGVAAVLAASGSYANAGTYDFSYTFDTSDQITGSFTGTGPVSDVTGISDITASFDGTPLGTLYPFSYTAPGTDCPTCFAAGGAVASSNALNNNFLFGNSPVLGSVTTYFYMIPWPNGSGNPEATQYYSPGTGYVDYYNGQLIPANWSLTAVPLPSTWLMLLSGFIGFGLLAYRAPRKRVGGNAAAA